MKRELILYRKVGTRRGSRVDVEECPKKALVDDLFFQRCLQHRWTICRRKNGDQKSVRAWMNGSHIPLHHFIWLLAGRTLPVYPQSIDHKNRNVLDNRLSNLREASQSLQRANARRRRNNTSGFKCVGKRRKKWRAVCELGGHQHYLGSRNTPKECARLVNQFYEIHHPDAPAPNPTV